MTMTIETSKADLEKPIEQAKAVLTSWRDDPQHEGDSLSRWDYVRLGATALQFVAAENTAAADRHPSGETFAQWVANTARLEDSHRLRQEYTTLPDGTRNYFGGPDSDALRADRRAARRPPMGSSSTGQARYDRIVSLVHRLVYRVALTL